MRNVVIMARSATGDNQQLNQQIQDCREFCKENKFNIVKEIKESYNGSSLNRPMIEEILDYIKSNPGQINAIVITRWDKLVRNHSLLIQFQNQMDELGIELICVEQYNNKIDMENLNNIFMSLPEVE